MIDEAPRPQGVAAWSSFGQLLRYKNIKINPLAVDTIIILIIND